MSLMYLPYFYPQAKVDQVPKLRESVGKLQERCQILEKHNDKVCSVCFVYFVYCVYCVPEFLYTNTAAGNLYFAAAP
jgi:hypothetical protein